MKIVVIEDHAIIRGLVEIVSRNAFKELSLASAREGRDGLELCKRTQPDLVLLDLELPDLDGFELVGMIRAAVPSVRILILSSHTEPYILHRVRQADVDGFVDKNEQSPEILEKALVTVAGGGRFFSDAVQQALVQLRADPQSFNKLLSEREQEMLRMFGQGLHDIQIAGQVKLSELTVRNHRRNIMAKLRVHSTPELIRYAVEHGFSRMKAKG